MTAQARLLGGRYQVGELLGYGGMAEVHRGRDLRLGRDVAIKMLRTDLARDDTFQMRFRREAQNAASLNHPAIVAVYDTGEEIAPTGETLPFIVMEFVNGRTLKEVLTAEGRLQPRRAMEITADMCAALEFSHRHSIIHRDIKPGNVMLTQTGQVKVMDFGIARALASGVTSMTQTSAVIGTAQYLSPEQARGEAVDARSDVYAAGCVLFELVCGHPPFVGDSPVSVAYQHVREAPPTPSDINPDVTAELDAIVLKALSKNPLNRYQSAGEMRADLLRAVSGRPVMATPVMRADETMALSAAGGGIPPRGDGTATRVVPAATADQGGNRKPWLVALLSGLAVFAVIALIAGLLLTGNDDDKPKLVAVPNVVNQSEQAAVDRLTASNLDHEFTPKEFGSCQKGNVTQQEPDSGEVDPATTKVKLTVCGGPETVDVPDKLVGQSIETARFALTQVGLEADEVPQDSAEPRGTVLKLDPPSGEAVAKGDKVKVYYSNGKIRPVPGVEGMTEEQARNALSSAGFKNVQVKTAGAPLPAGEVPRVVRQTPAASTSENIDSTITIFLPKVQEVEPTPTGEPTPTPEPSDDDGGDGGAGGGVGGGEYARRD